MTGLVVSSWFAVVADKKALAAIQAEKKAGDALKDKEKAEVERVRAQITQLRTADAGAVPGILAGLAPYRAEIQPSLRELWAELEGDRKARMRVGLALVASGLEAVREELFAWMLETEDPRELELTRNILEPYANALRDPLWTVVDKDPPKSVKHFRALVALALFDPDNPRWAAAAPSTLAVWLREDPLFFGVLIRALQPARKHLIQPLAEVAKGHDKELSDKRYEAAYVLTIYAADQAETLVDVLAESDTRQFALLLPRVRALAGETAPLLSEESEKGEPWLHPLTYPQRDALASRQANGALALLHLGQAKQVWPLLEHSLDPTRRTYLTLRMATHTVEARHLIDRLEKTTVVSERRALLSALGEYDAEQLPAELRERLVPRLLSWYRNDPDPGIHGMVDWLLRHGKEGPLPRKLDWGQAAALASIDEELPGRPVEERGWSVNSKGMTFVHFTGPIEFSMGSPTSEPGREDYELPHRRRIERSFALASRKVTVRDFEAFHKAHPEVLHDYNRKLSPEPNCPITKVTWYDAAQYCRWLSEVEGVPETEMCYPSIEELEKCKKNPLTPLKLPANHLSRKGYRLPTEAEWEYACRAGMRTAHAYGNGGEELLGVFAWYFTNSQERIWPVGQKRPNDYGLFDMHGNTWDWCQEPARKYVIGPEGFVLDKEDKGDIQGNLSCASRGGSFGCPASFVRCAYRNGEGPAYPNDNTGLRVARTL